MKKQDGRHLNQEDQHKRREEIIRLREEGKNNRDISKLVGCCPTHVSTIYQKYVKAGKNLEALEPMVRGRREGDQRLLSACQEKDVKKILLKQTPQELGINNYLWCREAIKSLIFIKFNIEIPVRLVTDYMRRWGLIIQKPVKSINKGISSNYNKWLKSQQNIIINESANDNFKIMWISNCIVKDVFYDKMPSHYRTNRNINILSSISNHGDIRFILYNSNLSTEILSSFIKRLHNDAKAKICLIFVNCIFNKFQNIRLSSHKLNENVRLEFLDDCCIDFNADTI